MAITITRRQAQQLRAVLRRAFGTRGPGPALGFIADAEGLRVRAMSADAAVEYHVPGARTAETLWLPGAFLADCEGKKDEPVELVAVGKGRCTAQWRDGSVPQLTEYDSTPPRDADKFPGLPEPFAENPPALLAAITAASETTDPTSARYALGCIRLRGEDGSLAGTDGRQLLVQRGFSFSWVGDVLVPRTKVFATDLAGEVPVRIGKTKEWLTIGVGPWFVHLRIDEQGRYPKVEQIIRPAGQATGVCRFSATDLRFLTETLPRLPMDADNDNRVTLDLNGQVIIRAKTAEQTRPTEVVLSGASWSGEPLRVNVNCRQMARAVKLGLSELRIFGEEAPVSWCDASRSYLSSPLSRDCCVEPAENAICIVSPVAETQFPVTQPQTRRRVSPVPEPTTNSNGNAAATVNSNGQSNGHAKANGQAKLNGEARNGTARKPGQNVEGLIKEAEALRTSLRDTLLKTNDLLKGLKRHRRQSRAVQQTIAQLRTLKTLGV